MERALFLIEPIDAGWSISGTIDDDDAFPTKLQAIHRASLLSYTHHMMTGSPTGVKVRMQCGDTVLMAMHG